MWVWGVARGVTGLLLEIGTIYISLHLRGQGVINIGVIVLLQTYVLTLIQQLGAMSHTFRNFFRCMAEIGEVVAIIDTPHSVIDKTDKKLKVNSGEIQFTEVNFSYDGHNNIFEHLSFKIKPGERVGLV